MQDYNSKILLSGVLGLKYTLSVSYMCIVGTFKTILTDYKW